jgi:hypothetical protein
LEEAEGKEREEWLYIISICDVWEGVLPERRGVEVKEQEHMGGEWVKRPKEAKGCEIWRALEGLGNVRVHAG